MGNDLTKNMDVFYSVVNAAMDIPGVRINREKFLRNELSKFYSKEIVNKAIELTPAEAGCKLDNIDKISNSCVNFETNKVTTISAATGIPGGLAMIGTVPADIAQYFAHIIIILQKLIYLYGWDDIYDNSDDFDDETKIRLTLFMGVMFGVNAASGVLRKVASLAAKNAEKKIAQKALTKGTIYPIVKKTASIIGAKMTKEIFAKGVAKLIPIVAALTSGGITYFSYKPCAKRLKEYLRTLPLAGK